MQCDNQDCRFLEPGQIVTVAAGDYAAAANGTTWIGLTRGYETTVPQDHLERAGEEQYEGRKNVQRCLQMIGKLAGRLLPFLGTPDVPVEELFSDNVLKFISLERELSASDKFGESKKS